MEFIGGDSIYEIYIDTYFLFNFWMNLWVLFLCRFWVHSKVKNRRVIVAAFLASLGEVIILCIPMGSGSVKLVLGFGGITAFIVAWLFRPGSLKSYQRLLIYSYLSALILGSVFLVMENILGKRKASLKVWMILAVCLFIFVKNIYRRISGKSDFSEVVLVFSKEERCLLRALIDSGNGLIEPISGQPVCLVEERAIAQYKKYLREEKLRIVPYHSVGNANGLLKAYFIEGMEIEQQGEKVIIENVLLAITNEVISVNERYQMILHPKIVNQGGLKCDF